MKQLIGNKINHIFVNEDQSILAFDTDKGIIAYKTYGDCCSETWFADIVGVDNLLDSIVSKAEKVEFESVDDGRSRQQEDSFYGEKLTTDKGICDIIYRNSSNGYYGGFIDHMEIPPDIASFTEIKSDWQA